MFTENISFQDSHRQTSDYKDDFFYSKHPKHHECSEACRLCMRCSIDCALRALHTQ